MRVGVVAHRKKTFGGGLPALRTLLEEHGATDLIWAEVDKSRRITKATRSVVADGAEVVLVWGGDGSVQRAVDALAGTDVPIGILPAGTANLFATNLGLPMVLEDAVDVALHGQRVQLDVGEINGEHFAVMAGTGFDALMIRDADGGLKDRLGRAAYVVTGARAAKVTTVAAKVKVDGHTWFEGDASCVLVGNAGTVIGGMEAFPQARLDDGRLDVGVVTAAGRLQWLRVLSRMVTGNAHASPFVSVTQGAEIDVRLAEPRPFELDGGDRTKSDRLRIRVRPRALTVHLPPVVPGGTPTPAQHADLKV